MTSIDQIAAEQVAANVIRDLENRRHIESVCRTKIEEGDVAEYLDDHYSGFTDEDVGEVFDIIEDRHQSGGADAEGRRLGLCENCGNGAWLTACYNPAYALYGDALAAWLCETCLGIMTPINTPEEAHHG